MYTPHIYIDPKGYQPQSRPSHPVSFDLYNKLLSKQLVRYIYNGDYSELLSIYPVLVKKQV